MPIKESVFREYDIRGKVDSELTLDEMYDLGCAIASYFIEKNMGVKTVAVGMDGRLHSQEIKEKVCQALHDSGLDVMFCGLCPSPALYFAMHTEPVQAGIMITASHNPKEYNGLKICLKELLVHGKEIKEIASYFQTRKRVNSPHKGRYYENSIVEKYVNWLVENFIHLKGMKRSVIVDCGNAVGGAVMPLLIEKMEWPSVELLYEEVDGNYPHHTADPTVEKNMQAVKKHLEETETECGFGLDGDCDRVGAMTKHGELITGDKLLSVFAKDILEKNPGAAVAFDIKSSSGLTELLKKWGGRPALSKTGHAFIKKTMMEHNALLGGELSCHFFFHDRYFGYDDGIYALIRVLEMLEKTGKKLEDMISEFPKKWSSPEFRISCPVENFKPIIADLEKKFEKRFDADVVTIDGIRATMPYGWGIVRASNTQPVLSIRFEAESPEELIRVKNDFIEVLRCYFDLDLLKKEILNA